MIWSDSLSDTDLARGSDTERLFFDKLIVLADDDGRGIADSEHLRAEIWRYHPRRTSAQVEKFLLSLASRMPNLVLYKVDGKPYYAFRKWTTYQRIRKDLYKPSKLPPPPDQVRNEAVTALLRQQTDVVTQSSVGQPSRDQLQASVVEKSGGEAGSASALAGANASPAMSKLESALQGRVKPATALSLYRTGGYTGFRKQLLASAVPNHIIEAVSEADLRDALAEVGHQ